MRKAFILAAIGAIAGVVALIGLLNGPRDVGRVPIAGSSLTATSSTEVATTTSTSVGTTTTAPTALWVANDTSLLTDVEAGGAPPPTRLIIGALDIDAPIGSYGVDDKGQMDVPDNITEVGWYSHGPSPGESGSAVLAAHVDLRGPGRGLFYELGDLGVGELIGVEYQDGSMSEFEVVARSTYFKSELPLEAIFSGSGDPILTLVTCGGGFSQSERSYDSNVVVYAVPVGSP
jgi:hypothetical protein